MYDIIQFCAVTAVSSWLGRGKTGCMSVLSLDWLQVLLLFLLLLLLLLLLEVLVSLVLLLLGLLPLLLCLLGSCSSSRLLLLFQQLLADGRCFGVQNALQ